VELKFSLTTHDARQRIAERIAKILLAGINKHELAPPVTNMTAYELSVAERVYLLNYKRWKYFCRGKQNDQQRKATDVFGRAFLRAVMKVLFLFIFIFMFVINFEF
jgi:hypothetical protein